MFSLWRRCHPSEDVPASGVIEMKGTEPKALTPRRHWRGIWTSSEPAECRPGLAESLPSTYAITQASAACRVSPSTATAVVNTQPTVEDGIIQSVPSTMQRRWSGVPAEASSVSPPEPSGCSAVEDGDFYEVNVVVKIPKAVAPKPAACSEHAALIENLEQEVAGIQLQLEKALRALDTKSKECEGLVRLVKELTESRSQLTAYKAVQGERFADLQQEYLRLVRVLELSRVVSRENIAKNTEITRKLNQVEEELSRQRLISQQTNERLASQKLANLELKDRLNTLERLDILALRRESACMVKFQQLHLKETY